MSVTSDVMELHLASLARHHQQPTWNRDHEAHHGAGQWSGASPVGSTHAELTQPPDLMQSSPLMALPLDFVVELIMPEKIIVVILKQALLHSRSSGNCNKEIAEFQ